MIPESIVFTGHEIEACQLVPYRVHPGPFPADWVRIVISYSSRDARDLVSWLMENVDGRFGVMVQYFGVMVQYSQAAIYFERDVDAVMFRLKDGDNAFAQADFHF